jgi:IS4 transposase
VGLNWTPPQVYQKYRRRFGIECAYRLLRQVKVLTNSRNPAPRFFLLGLGLVMQNVWVHLRWLCTRRPSRGRYKLIPTLLRFDRFRKLLIRAIDSLFPPLKTVLVYALPNS